MLKGEAEREVYLTGRLTGSAVEQPGVEATTLLPTTLSLAMTLGALWAGWLALVCYAEVNRFSIWRATAAGLLGSAIALVVLVLPLGVLVFWLMTGVAAG